MPRCHAAEVGMARLSPSVQRFNRQVYSNHPPGLVEAFEVSGNEDAEVRRSAEPFRPRPVPQKS